MNNSEYATQWRANLAAARALGHVSSEEIAKFFCALNAKVSATYIEKYPTCEGNHFTVGLKVGMKYAKLVRLTPGQEGGSAYVFVDLTNGDILKPESWKAPAKHARGNIRLGSAANWWSNAMDETSVTYMN